jgi:hypothetical protein
MAASLARRRLERKQAAAPVLGSWRPTTWMGLAARSDPGDLGAGMDDGVGVLATCVRDLGGEVFGRGDDVLDDLPGVVAVYGAEQLAALLPAAATVRNNHLIVTRDRTIVST